jgi:hypothetical protein
MRRLYISESLVERRFRDTWQYRILLNKSEIQRFAIDLLGLLYDLIDGVEVSGANPPAIRLKYDAVALASARIVPNSTYWTITLSRTELEVWLKFLVTSLIGIPFIDHIDLIDETHEDIDLQFTLAITGEIETVNSSEARKRLEC